MLRFALVILLVNTYGLSFGLPVGQQSGNGTMIGNLLSELAKGCKSEFVVSIINSTLDECNLSIAPITESSIRCSMFYDASSVLCNLTKTTNTSTLAADFAAKTKTNQDFTEFCHEAAHFKLPLTRFHTNISKVLHKETICTVVCADKQILNEDTSFYCKYYKWMLEIVNSHITPVVKKKKEPVGQVAIGEHNKTKDTLVTDAANALDGLPKKQDDNGISLDAYNKTSTNAVDTNPSHVEAQPESSLTPVPSLRNETIVETALENSIVDTQVNNLDQHDGQGGGNIDLQPDNGTGHGNNLPKGVNGDPDGEEEDPDLDGTEDQVNHDSEVMEDDEADNKLDDSDKTPDKKEGGPKVINKPESSHGDTYVNPIDGYTDDDDHFFPFFLTAVIVVVVLYVLYHNKNKVAKMFFGLIVEGRQSGRRRTSRGHAYRRLDTLEQAMSANAGAPPSKIIY